MLLDVVCEGNQVHREILACSRNSRTGLQHESFALKTIIREIKDGLDIKESPSFSFLEEYNEDTRIYSDKGRLRTSPPLLFPL